MFHAKYSKCYAEKAKFFIFFYSPLPLSKIERGKNAVILVILYFLFSFNFLSSNLLIDPSYGFRFPISGNRYH